MPRLRRLRARCRCIAARTLHAHVFVHQHAGHLIFLAAFVGGAIQGASAAHDGRGAAATVKQMMPTVITMLSVLGCAKVMGYAGMISSHQRFCIAVAGGLYPILAPWIGAVGAFVTGLGHVFGMLFGPIQSQAATALGVSDYWMVALNALGVAAGKTISADARDWSGCRPRARQGC